MAAPTNYYVDPSIAADTGTGTIGDPFGDLQYGLNTVSRDGTNGDQFNIKAGTAEVLAAPLSLATYGAPAAQIPLVLRGYTAAANDGGVGAINANSKELWAATTNAGIRLVHLTVTNLVGQGVRASAPLVYECSLSHSGNYALRSDSGGMTVIGSHIVASGQLIYSGNGPIVALGNYMVRTSGWAQAIVGYAAADARIIGNILYETNTTSSGFSLAACTRGVFCNNVVVGSAKGAALVKLAVGAGDVPISMVANNIVIGASGVGGCGLDCGYAYMVGYNAFYNNTADYSLGTVIADETAHDVALAADPFTDAANGDFSLTAAAQAALADAGWPEAYLGAHANTDGHITIGPIQYGSGGGGVGGGMLSANKRGNKQ